MQAQDRQEWENAPEAIQQANTLQASEQTRDWGEANEGKSWNESRRKSRAEEAEERKSAQAPFDMAIEGKGVNTQTILLQANQRPSCPFFGS